MSVVCMEDTQCSAIMLDCVKRKRHIINHFIIQLMRTT